VPDKRDLKLNSANISKSAYREMYYFCRRYNEMKEKLTGIYSPATSSITGMPKAYERQDKTADKAIKAAKLSYDISLIENAAKSADDQISGYILKNVCGGSSYDYLKNTLGMPCGRNQFYKARRLFFYNIYKNKIEGS